ncbi:MAG TPA: peptidoglycan-binding protein, partial [Rhodospirillales bacterium]|nr:peptidoglycan-binding protein [Rhodospirillales bacterium]
MPWLLVVIAAFIFLRVTSVAAEAPAPLAAAVQRTIEAAGPTLTVTGKPVETEALKTVYEQRQYNPIWVDSTGINSRGQALLQAFAGAARDGLEPADYDPGAAARTATGVDQLAATEVGLSASLLRYTTDIRRGRAVPEKMDSDQRIAPRPIDPVQVLQGAASAPDLDAYISLLAPADPFYLGLRQALDRYRSIASAGGWPTIAAGGKLGVGSIDPRVRDLRRHLQLSGDLAADPNDQPSNRVDDALRQAVQRFQERHGLPATGEVNAGTLQALNIPVATRIRQILINLERARWLPEDLGDPYVLVN